MKKYLLIAVIIVGIMSFLFCNHGKNKSNVSVNKFVSQGTMEKIFNEIKTPYKYGVVLKHPDSTKMIDSPTIFRKDSIWYMTYIVFDGQGYETWLAGSENLLNWKTRGKILSFTENTWDANQKAGYLSLVDINWGGSYNVEKFQNKYWMSYLGGATKGYESGTLGIGLANSSTISEVQEWKRIEKPVLLPNDKESRWFENKTIFKSLIIHDKNNLTGYPFVMYYNAKGDSANFESIGMAVSNDMISWKRLGSDPVITKQKGICGDAQIAKINNLYVLFYFGAFWKPGAFERFACSYDLMTWTDWNGEDLIAPSKDYDEKYAHKPWVIKWNGIVYHFYNAVGKNGRVIALSTSKEIKND
ncbi:MAG: glycosylase [Bacteroidales bacterium]